MVLTGAAAGWLQVWRARKTRLLPTRVHEPELHVQLLGRDHLQGAHVQGELRPSESLVVGMCERGRPHTYLRASCVPL